MTQRAPFTVDPDLTGIAMAYRNEAMIADQVLPRVPVTRKEYKFKLWDKPNAFTVPETRVGRASQPNRVEFEGSEVTGSAEDYGLEDPIPNEDIDNAPAGMDPLANATQMLADLVALDREQRVANVVFGASNYPSANKVTLTSTDRWDVPENAASNPIDDILTGLDACMMRPNVMVIGQAVSRYLRTHPRIVKAFNGTAGDTGIVPIRALEDLFEVRVLVGMSWYNTAKAGQTASYSRLWGKFCALLHLNPQARNVNGNAPTFGWTAQYGSRIAGTIIDPNIGLRGGRIVRVGESVGEKVVASDLGYLITSPIS